MSQNGKPVDFLSSVEVFSETMEERHGKGKNNLTIIASNGAITYDYGFGTTEDTIDAMSTALYNDEDLFNIMDVSLALAKTAKLRDQTKEDDDTD